MKPPIAQDKYDLCEILCIYNPSGKIVKKEWRSTAATNLPYRIIRNKMIVLSGRSDKPRGVYYVPVKNGERPDLSVEDKTKQLKI